MALLSAEITRANLVPGKIFAGHDAGFSPYFAGRMLQLATSVWNIKDAFGFPDFLAPVAIPYAALESVVQGIVGPDPTRLSAAYYFLGLFITGSGSGWLTAEILTLHRVPPWKVALAACVAAVLAIANPYIAELFNWPVIAFQFGIVLWPAVIALAINTYATPTRAVFLKLPILLLGIVFAFMGNPAHSMLGLFAILVLFVAMSVQLRRVRLSIFIGFALAVVGATAYFWVPTVATATLFHGETIIREGLKYQEPQILADQLRETARASLGNLVRLDGDSWWPQLSVAAFMSSPSYIVLGFMGIVLATFSLLRRSAVSVALWLLLIVGIELAKDIHGPLGFYSPTIFMHVGAYAAFRETYDKFILLALIALPPLAGLGLAYISGRKPNVLAPILVAIPLCALLQPFCAGRIADPLYQTSLPPDYARIASALPGLRDSRVLVLPGNYLDLQATTWFVGMNLDSFLLSNNVVNGTIFRQRAISSAPMYSDVDLKSVEDLPALIRMLPVFGIHYVILHKDTPTEHSPRERASLVLGPLFVNAAEPILDRSDGLKKVFEGRYLAVYKCASLAPMITSAESLQTVAGYNDALAQLAGHRRLSIDTPTLLLGNGNALSRRDRRRLSKLNRLTIYAPINPQPPGLYPEQNSIPTAVLQTEATSFERGPSGRIRFPITATYLDKGRSFQRFDAVEGPGRRWGARVYPSSMLGPFSGSLDPSVWSAAVNRSHDASVEYAYPLSPPDVRGSYRDESAEAHSFPPISLRDLPTADFLAESSKGAKVWLRFYLRSSSGQRAILDQQIQNNVPLLNYDIRAALQGFLDARNSESIASLWRSASEDRRPNYMPPQADAYSIYGIGIVQSPQPLVPRVKSISLKYFAMFAKGSHEGLATLAGVKRGRLSCDKPECSFTPPYFMHAKRVRAFIAAAAPGVVDARFSVRGKRLIVPLASIGTGGALALSPVATTNPGGIIWSPVGKRFVLSGIIGFEPLLVAQSAGIKNAQFEGIAVKASPGAAVEGVATVYRTDIQCSPQPCSIAQSVALIPPLATLPRSQISYRKLDPTLYRVTVSKPTKIITLAQTYHPGWVIERADTSANTRFKWLFDFDWLRELSRSRARTHFTVNGYANGWLTSDLHPGSYVIDFIPQDIAYLADLLSGLSLVAYGLLCLLAYLRGTIKRVQ